MRNRVVLALCGFFAIFALLCFVKVTQTTCPESYLKVQTDRHKIETSAKSYLYRILGDTFTHYRVGIEFTEDVIAKYFLLRNASDTLRNIIEGGKSLWCWRVTFHVPDTGDTITVDLHPESLTLVGFHKRWALPYAQPLDTRKAQQFVTSLLHKILGEEVDKFVYSGAKRLGPSYLQLLWYEADFNVKGARYGIIAYLTDDGLKSVRIGFILPADTYVDYNRNYFCRLGLTYIAAFAIFLLILIPLSIHIVTFVRWGWISIRELILCFTVTSVLVFATTYSMFGTHNIRQNLLISLAISVVTSLALLVGRHHYAMVAPFKLYLKFLPTPIGIRTREFFYSTLIGYYVGFLQLGWLALVHAILTKRGLWLPLILPARITYNMKLPYLIFLPGLTFAMLNESLFRLYGISWLNSKVRLLPAICVVSSLWGFGFSLLPQSPHYLYGVTIAIWGIVLGFVLVKFGLLATVISQFVVITIVLGLPLFYSDAKYSVIFVSINVILFLYPLIFTAIHYLRTGQFHHDTTILNLAWKRTPPEPTITRWEEPPYIGAGIAAKCLLLCITILFAVIALRIPNKILGANVRVTVNWHDVEKISDSLAKSYNLKGFIRVVEFKQRTQGPVERYIYQVAGIDRLNELCVTELPYWYWEIKLINPSTHKQCIFKLDADGKLYSHTYKPYKYRFIPHVGFTTAYRIAMDYLHKRGLSLKGYHLTKKEVIKYPSYEVYVFEWTRSELPNLTKIIHIEVIGNEAHNFDIRYELSTATTVGLSKFHMLKHYWQLVIKWLTIAIIAFMLILHIAKRELVWRAGLVFLAFIAITYIMYVCNTYVVNFYRGYDGTVGVTKYVVTKANSTFIQFVAIIVCTFLSISLQATLFRTYTSRKYLLPHETTTSYLGSAIYHGILGGASLFFFIYLVQNLFLRLRLPLPRLPSIVLPDLACLYPGATLPWLAYNHIVFKLLPILTVTFFAFQIAKYKPLTIMLMVIYIATLSLWEATSPQDILFSSLYVLTFIAYVLFVVRYFWRDNLPAYWIGAGSYVLTTYTFHTYMQSQFYFYNGLVGTGIFLVFTICALAICRRIGI